MSKRHSLKKPQGAPLAASAEPARLIMLPGVENASGGVLCGIATGHPRRPQLRLFKSMDAALAVLRQMSAERMA